MVEVNHFDNLLNVILEEASIFTPAVQKLAAIDEAKANLEQTHAELRHSLAALNGELATAIRRANNNLDVWLDRTDGVRVQYGDRTRSLRLKADARIASWAVGDTPFERQFHKYNQNALKADPQTLATAISNYFINNYKTMQRIRDGRQRP